MTLDNETEMDLLRKMGVMWTLFSTGSRHGEVFTVDTLMAVRDGRDFKDRREVDAFLRWALREKLVQEADGEYRFADDARDVYWFYMDGEEIPPDDAELSPEARAKADAIAELVQRKHWPQVQVSSDPTPAQYKILNSHAAVAHGMTPATISIPAGGPYTIQVEMTGYEPWSIHLVLQLDEQYSVNAVLNRVPPKTVIPSSSDVVPHGLTKLTGISADPRWRMAIVNALYRRFGTRMADKDDCFGFLRQEFGWGDQVPGNAIGRVFYALDEEGEHGLIIRWEGGFYQLTKRAIALAKEE